MKVSLAKIAKYTGGTLQGDEGAIVKSAVIDSRKVKNDCLFVALKGERTDGHVFVESALNSGAKAALVQKEYIRKNNENVVVVEDTAKAMGDIAAGILKDRGESLIKVAVTGSVGKTSTKDMIAFVFASYFNTLKSELNHNNELGLPMTVMKLEDEHEVLVSEMGMRGIGHVEYLTNIVKPNIAIITNIGIAHLEHLGTRENILRAKLEVCKGMKEGGTLVLNGDNDMLSNESAVRSIIKEYGAPMPKIVYFGTDGNSEYKATNIHGSSYVLKTPDGKEIQVKLKVPGVHNVYNSMAAVCVAGAAGISVEKAVTALENFGDDVSRQKIIETPWGILVDDTYNASPESMEASLSVLSELKADVKIAALADMLELGDMTETAHRRVGKKACECVDVLVAVGNTSVLYYEEFSGVRKLHLNDSAAGANELTKIIGGYMKEGKRVALLAKGSNAMRMNIISEALIHYGGL